MTINNLVQGGLYVALLILLAWPLGSFMARLYEGKRTILDPVLGPLERFLYRLAGVKPEVEMKWTAYAGAMLVFNLLGLLAVYVIQRFQHVLPLNPQALGAVSPDLSFNTAVSFATNTNWQSYGGETTMSYFTQMMALTVQNFVSAATGMAVLVALIRGLARKQVETVAISGSTWCGAPCTSSFPSPSFSPCSSSRRAWCRRSRLHRGSPSSRRPGMRTASP